MRCAAQDRSDPNQPPAPACMRNGIDQARTDPHAASRRAVANPCVSRMFSETVTADARAGHRTSTRRVPSPIPWTQAVFGAASCDGQACGRVAVRQTSRIAAMSGPVERLRRTRW
jgi:hypothetical protein